jgi:hypothetical protein
MSSLPDDQQPLNNIPTLLDSFVSLHTGSVYISSACFLCSPGFLSL